MWQQRLAPLIKAGKLTVIGVVQEQHADRARLYRQWRQLDWPLAIDPTNELDLRVVPVPLLVDEAGVIRAKLRKPAELEAFLARPAVKAGAHPRPAVRATLAQIITGKPGCGTAGEQAASLLHMGELDRAVAAYEALIKAHPTDARWRFRLGVALRRRSERAAAKPGDAQAAVARWGEALAMEPGQYIWRRRLQQYGPRLAKPYPFFTWVKTAREAITARGETPHPLRWEPAGSELAGPARGGEAVALGAHPDPQGKLPLDADQVSAEALVTPASVRPGGRVRLRIRLVPGAAVTWTDEGQPASAWLKLPPGWKLFENQLTHPREAKPSSQPRLLECELAVPADASGVIQLPIVVTYDTCEKATGVCRRLRRNLVAKITVDAKAIKLGR